MIVMRIKVVSADFIEKLNKGLQQEKNAEESAKSVYVLSRK